MIAPMRMTRLDRVQLAMPAGGEDLACAFYDGALGIPATQEPANLAQRCSGWFERGELKIHLGVELDFRPACKAHCALRRIDLRAFIERLRALGDEVRQGKACTASTSAIHSAIALSSSNPFAPQGERAQTPLRAQALANTRRPLAANSMIGVE